MPVSKRPRKSSKLRKLLLPLTARHDTKSELPVQLAVAALGTGDFGESQAAKLFIHGEMVRDAGTAMNHPEAHELGVEVVNLIRGIIERYVRTGKYGVTGPEFLRLKEITSATLPWLRLVPNTVLHRIIVENRKKRGLVL